MINKKLIILMLVIAGLTATLCSCWKRYDTYINDKVLVPRFVSINYDVKEGYQFVQAGYKCKFISEPSPPLNNITFYKLHITENNKPVIDLKPTINAYFLESKHKEPVSIMGLEHESTYPGWYKGMLDVKIGGVYKFEIVCKNKNDVQVIKRSLNIAIHNIPSEKDFKAYEKDRIAKEKKEFDRKKAIEKRKAENRKAREKKDQKGSITPAERYAAQQYFAEIERYREQERYNSTNSKTKANDAKAKKPSDSKATK